MSSSSSSSGWPLPFADSSLSFLSLPPCCETALGRHVTSLPPGQATQILQLYAQHLREWCAGEEVGVAVARCVAELGVVLSHLPLTLWCGRSGRTAVEALRMLVEEGCAQMMTLAGRAHAPVATPLSIAALLLTSRCCDLLARLHPHPLASELLPQWPVQLEPAPSNQPLLLPKVWMGKRSPTLQPAVTVLLVSAIGRVAQTSHILLIP